MPDTGLGALGVRLLILVEANSVSCVPQDQGVEGAYLFDQLRVWDLGDGHCSGSRLGEWTTRHERILAFLQDFSCRFTRCNFDILPISYSYRKLW
jgi:hypothetical protein